MNRPVPPNFSIETATKASASFSSQLLATKFFVPVAPSHVITRPRLNALLDKSLAYPLTLVSAPAGFGKTTLLSTWVQSLPAHGFRFCWLSLDEEDNDPQLFWTGVLSVLDRQLPDHFAPLLLQLQSPPRSPLKQLLAALINLLAESVQRFVLILDDYQVITQEQVHTTLSYLIQHLPPQLHIIIATRADPPLPLPIERARHHILEVRADQLRCTVEETGAFFHEVIGIHLPNETIQQISSRTEGWLVGLQLLGLSLPEHVDPLTLLEEVSGDQRYILDYLTEEVLQRQPQEVQTFLLCTSILEQFNASLCDAITEQRESQQMLYQLEQANLFVVSLDSRRQWYRYHALFAEALRYQLEQRHPDQVLILHHRASIWYAEHDQTFQAILHAFSAHQWDWAADLIESKVLQVISFTWGASVYQSATLQSWLEQLPLEVMGSRPHLYLACAVLLAMVAPYKILLSWFNAAKAALTASLMTQVSEDSSYQIQRDLLGQVIAWEAIIQGCWVDNAQPLLALCQQALTLLSDENTLGHAFLSYAKLLIYYFSSANDAVASIASGLEGRLLAQQGGHTSLATNLIGSVAMLMIGAGQLHESYQLILQSLFTRNAEELMLPESGWLFAFQADILREWNQLDAAYAQAQKAASLCQQMESTATFATASCAYAVLLHVSLSYGELDMARSALQEFDGICMKMNQPFAYLFRSLYTTVDQVRLWLACGELDRATHWARELDLKERCDTPFAHEREEVACARVLLAQQQPAHALERLEPVLQRATAGQRWGHVIEIRLLQALAYQMGQQEKLALDALCEAVRLAEPEGYLRSFVDEGAPVESMLYRLRKVQRPSGPTPYLDMLLAAFQQETKTHAQREEPAHHRLPEPLSQREREILQLLARGASNQEIAQELVIALDTVKRHVSHIFAKLDVNNRVQAVRQARELGFLDEETLLD